MPRKQIFFLQFLDCKLLQYFKPGTNSPIELQLPQNCEGLTKLALFKQIFRKKTACRSTLLGLLCDGRSILILAKPVIFLNENANLAFYFPVAVEDEDGQWRSTSQPCASTIYLMLNRTSNFLRYYISFISLLIPMEIAKV